MTEKLRWLSLASPRKCFPQPQAKEKEGEGREVEFRKSILSGFIVLWSVFKMEN